MYAYDPGWLALAVALTLVAAALTFASWRRWGVPALLTGLGWTLLPAGLYLTGTLRILGAIVNLVSGYVAGFVFNPTVWMGVGLLVTAAASWLLGRTLSAKRAPRRVPRRERRLSEAGSRTGVPPAATGASVSAGASGASGASGAAGSSSGSGLSEDDEIEALLRRRGIN